MLSGTMGPTLEICGLTRERDQETIQRFLDLYVDRAASEDRGDEELMMEPLGATEEPRGLRDSQWEPALTLTHAVRRGLDYPRRAFFFYLQPSRPGIDRAILSFTSDDQLILGLVVPDEEDAASEPQARDLMYELAKEFRCHLAAVLAESPPPRDELAFRGLEQHPLTIFFEKFDVR